MKLQDLPLLMEGLHQVKAGSGDRSLWYINRWADIPEKWVWKFKRIEYALAKAAGMYVRTAFVGKMDPSWIQECDRDCSALAVIYCCTDDSTREVLTALDIYPGVIDEVEWLFNTFFDGDAESDHQVLNTLFVTKEYMV